MMSLSISAGFFVNFKLPRFQYKAQLQILRDLAGLIISTESERSLAGNCLFLQPYIPLIQNPAVLGQQGCLDQRHLAFFLRQVNHIPLKNDALALPIHTLLCLDDKLVEHQPFARRGGFFSEQAVESGAGRP